MQSYIRWSTHCGLIIRDGLEAFGEEKKNYFLSLEPKGNFSVVRFRVNHFIDCDVLIQFLVLNQNMACVTAENNDRFGGRGFKHATSRIPNRGDILPN